MNDIAYEVQQSAFETLMKEKELTWGDLTRMPYENAQELLEHTGGKDTKFAHVVYTYRAAERVGFRD